jgi:hypothetical protein
MNGLPRSSFFVGQPVLAPMLFRAPGGKAGWRSCAGTLAKRKRSRMTSKAAPGRAFRIDVACSSHKGDGGVFDTGTWK